VPNSESIDSFVEKEGGSTSGGEPSRADSNEELKRNYWRGEREKKRDTGGVRRVTNISGKGGCLLTY